jgi:hypothetical protein
MAEEPLKCFVISPIGEQDSEIRIAADFFREDIVAAALNGKFEVKRADDYSAVGNITSQVIEAINEANLIVADLTGRNANVYYELGVAHSYKKHVVPMINMDDPNPIPFDNYTERTIRYSLKTVHTKKVARERLAAAVQATMNEPVRNPVTTALGLAEAATGDSRDQLIATMTEQMAGLARKVEDHQRYFLALELERWPNLTQTERQAYEAEVGRRAKGDGMRSFNEFLVAVAKPSTLGAALGAGLNPVEVRGSVSRGLNPSVEPRSGHDASVNPPKKPTTKK